jgi:hypothetical protein
MLLSYRRTVYTVLYRTDMDASDPLPQETIDDVPCHYTEYMPNADPLRSAPLGLLPLALFHWIHIHLLPHLTTFLHTRESNPFKKCDLDALVYYNGHYVSLETNEDEADLILRTLPVA